VNVDFLESNFSNDQTHIHMCAATVTSKDSECHGTMLCKTLLNWPNWFCSFTCDAIIINKNIYYLKIQTDRLVKTRHLNMTRDRAADKWAVELPSANTTPACQHKQFSFCAVNFWL
jgi:hypothetical protein